MNVCVQKQVRQTTQMNTRKGTETGKEVDEPETKVNHRWNVTTSENKSTRGPKKENEKKARKGTDNKNQEAAEKEAEHMSKRKPRQNHPEA